MFRIPVLAACAALLVAGGIPVTASAVDSNITLNSSGYTSFGTHSRMGSFTDNYFFNVPATNSLSAGASDLKFTLGGMDILNIAGLNLRLVRFVNSQTSEDVGSGTNFTVNSPAPGSYRATVTGNANGMNGGIYSAGVTMVPEPSTWGMMIGGLGVLGLMLRRRKEGL